MNEPRLEPVRVASPLPPSGRFLEILTEPDPRLRLVAEPVLIGSDVQQLVLDLLHTMAKTGAVGLAATQVGVPLRVFVLGVPGGVDHPRVFVNPVVLDQLGRCRSNEGCFSLPGKAVVVRRSEWVKFGACDENWKPFLFAARGLVARAMQHELDHLNGVLMTDPH